MRLTGGEIINRRSLLFNTVALTLSSLINRTIDMIYTVFMSNKIGSEGMGLYQLIISIYIMAATLVTSGIGTAVCITLTEQTAKNGRCVIQKIMKQCIFLAVLLSIIAAAALYFTAPVVSQYVFKDTRTEQPLKILIFSLFFMAVSSCLKGYFYAERGFIQTIAAQVLEQLVKITVFFIAVTYFIGNNIELSCSAAALGITISEFSSCACLLVLYLKEKPQAASTKHIKLKNTAYKAASVALPIAVGSYISSVLRMLENVLLPKKLIEYGVSASNSLSELGLLKGMVIPVLVFPAAFLSSFAVSLIPEVSEGSAKTGKLSADNIVSRVLQITFIFSIFTAGIFFALGKEIGLALYKNEQVGVMLKILAIAAPCMYIEMISGAVLNGLGQQVSILKYNTFDGVLQILLILITVPLYGLNGYMCTILATSIISFTLFFSRLIKFAEFDIKVAAWIIKPVIAIAAADYSAYVLLKMLNKDAAASAVIGILFTGFVYLLWLIATGALSRDDIKWFSGKLKIKTKNKSAVLPSENLML